MNNVAEKILIITAPSGAGKTSVTTHLLQLFPQLEFSVSAASENVLVEWKTDQESNSLKFDVERSADGVSWKQIGSVNAAGTSSSASQIMVVA